MKMFLNCLRFKELMALRVQGKTNVLYENFNLPRFQHRIGNNIPKPQGIENSKNQNDFLDTVTAVTSLQDEDILEYPDGFQALILLVDVMLTYTSEKV